MLNAIGRILACIETRYFWIVCLRQWLCILARLLIFQGKLIDAEYSMDLVLKGVNARKNDGTSVDICGFERVSERFRIYGIRHNGYYGKVCY